MLKRPRHKVRLLFAWPAPPVNILVNGCDFHNRREIANRLLVLVTNWTRQVLHPRPAGNPRPFRKLICKVTAEFFLRQCRPEELLTSTRCDGASKPS